MRKILGIVFVLFTAFIFFGCADKDAITKMQAELAQKKQELIKTEEERRKVGLELSEIESALKKYTDTRDRVKQEFEQFYGENPNVERMVKCALKQIDPVMSFAKAMLSNNAEYMKDSIVCGTMQAFGGEKLEEVSNKVTSMKQKFESADSKVSELMSAFEEKRAKKAILDDNTTSDRLKQEIMTLETDIACEQSFWCRIKK